jgi:uncharacterized YigZ family protein
MEESGGAPGPTERYPVPAGTHRREEVVERSRFIATIERARTAEEARAFVERVRAEFPDATHNCWAFVAGPPGDSAAIGMSDDGEPHGTAGRPMLDALLHGGVGEVAAVVSRWFGGVKLGKGGLGRAYAGAVAGALETLPVVEHVSRSPLSVVVGYAAIDGLKRLLEELGVETRREEYGAEVIYRVAVPVDRRAEFEEAVATLTAGAGRILEEGGEPATE